MGLCFLGPGKAKGIGSYEVDVRLSSFALTLLLGPTLTSIRKREVYDRCIVSQQEDREFSAQERLEGAKKGAYQLAETYVCQYGAPLPQ
jgi:hypothetical protein